MEQGKSRFNSLLAFTVFLNLILTLTSIGFMVYKVRVLEEQVFQLQDLLSRSSANIQTDTKENGAVDVTNRQKRSSKSYGESKSCARCHNACVNLFGLGASAKVRTYRNFFKRIVLPIIKPL